MEYNLFKYLLAHTHENGFTAFILGVLFVLSAYHFLLFFQNKDKVYLYYSLYTFLIFLNQTKFVLNNINYPFVETYKSVMYDFHQPIVWVYNTFYFVFGFTFLNLKKHSKRWHLFIFTTVKLLFTAIIIVVITFVTTSNYSYIIIGDKALRTSLYIFGIVCYYPLLAVKMPLRKYIIVGSFVLYISSLIGQYGGFYFSFFKETSASNSVFYIGVIIENLIFSLGLGQKQKQILQDKNESQSKLIEQLKENDALRLKIHKQLEKDVASINKRAEKDKFEKIKAEYEKELLALKISSLRSQMNPHFIFNSLNAIKLYIIENDKENAVYYLNKFSKLIRKILAVTREKEITLAEEIETIKLYIDIENIRFHNEIDTSFSIDNSLNLNTIRIPSLIVQPFIENAIWHGLSSKKGQKKLSLFLKKEEDFVKITIEDNGIGREKSKANNKRKIYKKDSIGIQLTKDRLSNFSKNLKNNFLITFTDLKDAQNNALGTQVVLKIPLN